MDLYHSILIFILSSYLISVNAFKFERRGGPNPDPPSTTSVYPGLYVGCDGSGLLEICKPLLHIVSDATKGPNLNSFTKNPQILQTTDCQITFWTDSAAGFDVKKQDTIDNVVTEISNLCKASAVTMKPDKALAKTSKNVWVGRMTAKQYGVIELQGL